MEIIQRAWGSMTMETKPHLPSGKLVTNSLLLKIAIEIVDLHIKKR